MDTNKHSFQNRFKSFQYAFEGIATLFKEEPNAKIHLTIAILTIVAGFVFQISNTEWMVTCIFIGLVFALEAINTAIEHIANFISPERNEHIKKIKDLSAAAVLMVSLAAIVVGLIIFIPKILSL